MKKEKMKMKKGIAVAYVRFADIYLYHITWPVLKFYELMMRELIIITQQTILFLVRTLDWAIATFFIKRLFKRFKTKRDNLSHDFFVNTRGKAGYSGKVRLSGNFSIQFT